MVTMGTGEVDGIEGEEGGTKRLASSSSSSSSISTSISASISASISSKSLVICPERTLSG